MNIERIEALQASDYLAINELSSESFLGLIDTAHSLKQMLKAKEKHAFLEGQGLAMIFEKPSLRTRSTFDLAMFQLGGHAVYLGQQEISLGKRESIRDVASNLERWFDGIMARTFEHNTVVELAEHSSVPVINGLTDFLHPCQLLADYLALKEHFNELEGIKLVFVGDGNNVANSHINAAALTGVHLTIACPEDYVPDTQLLQAAQKLNPNITLAHGDPREAIQGADAIYTDVWTSMGQEEETEKRLKDFAGYTITTEWLNDLSDRGVFMHDLPAHYGEECTEEVLHHKQSIAFDQAENRLHAHKAILYQLLS